MRIPEAEELSGIGAAYAAGMALEIFDKKIFTADALLSQYGAPRPENAGTRYVLSPSAADFASASVSPF